MPATTEFFSLGIGVGGTTEAIRTEDVEFLVSFPDMLKEFGNPNRRLYLYNDCYFENGLLLESDLGLTALVNSALNPIGSGVLYQGNNVGPGVNAVQIPADQLNDISAQLEKLKSVSNELPKPPPGLSINDLGNLSLNKSQFNALIKKFNIPNENLSKSENEFRNENIPQPADVASVKAILALQNDATTEETRTQAIINNIVKPMFSIATQSLDPLCLAEATQSQFEAITWAARVSLDVIDVDKATDENAAQTTWKAVKDAKNQVVKYATQMISQIAICSARAKKAEAEGSATIRSNRCDKRNCKFLYHRYG